MKVFITGGCGMIGSHVAEALLARGDEVLVIDNLATGRKEHLKEQPNLKVVIGTIADNELVENIVAEFKPDAVLHAAASYKDPNDWYNDTLTNCVGGANVIKSSLNNNIKRFVYLQTSLCYGIKPLEQPITLNHHKFPDSSYAITKTVCEDFLEMSSLKYVTFRLANVIGPRNVSGPLPIFYQRLSEGKRCFVTKARRDFVFVNDLVKIIIRAFDGEGSGTYHFSSGKDVSIKELYDAVVKAMNLTQYPEPEIREIGNDEAPSILLDPSRTFMDFGEIEFSSIETIVSTAISNYVKIGAIGGYTHLKQS